MEYGSPGWWLAWMLVLASIGFVILDWYRYDGTTREWLDDWAFTGTLKVAAGLTAAATLTIGASYL